MPRHTHPPARAKHSRRHTRAMRDRYVQRRWQQAKARYAHLTAVHPDAQRDLARQDPDRYRYRFGVTDTGTYGWPFTLPDSRLARNPFTLCSCWMCSWRSVDNRRRRRAEQRAWRLDVDVEAHHTQR